MRFICALGLLFAGLLTGCAGDNAVLETTPASVTTREVVTHVPGSTTTSKRVELGEGGIPSATVTTVTEVQGAVNREAESKGVGVGVKASGEAVKGKVDTTAPRAGLEGVGEAQGGGLGLSLSLSKIFDPGSKFFWLGCIGIVAALALGLWLHMYISAAACAASGLFFMVASVWTWLLIPGFVLCVVGLIYEAYKHGFFKEGFRAFYSGTKDTGKADEAENLARKNHATGTDEAAMAAVRKLEA